MGLFSKTPRATEGEALAALRPDLKHCAEQVREPTVTKALAKGGPMWAPPPDIPSSEEFLAVYPSHRWWEDATHRYQERGMLYLTSARLFWRSGESGFEVPLGELTVAGLRTERRKYYQFLHIAIGPSQNPSYQFEVGKTGTLGDVKEDPGYDFFLKTLQATVREDESARRRTPSRGAGASAADELEKFAKLREQGVISDEEFDAKKNQLLGL